MIAKRNDCKQIGGTQMNFLWLILRVLVSCNTSGCSFNYGHATDRGHVATWACGVLYFVSNTILWTSWYLFSWERPAFSLWCPLLKGNIITLTFHIPGLELKLDGSNLFVKATWSWHVHIIFVILLFGWSLYSARTGLYS